jgi:broad specificity phosphatase PhoE
MGNGNEMPPAEGSQTERVIELPASFQDCSFFTIRHADAHYQRNEEIVASKNPEGPFVPSEQDFNSDLSLEGQERAKEKAEMFLSQFDPNKDSLYFASSNLVRARETASIFLTEAKSRGFEIIQATTAPSHKIDSSIQEQLGGNEIRTLESLSLNIKNMLAEFIFHPHNYLNPHEGEGAHVFHPENVSLATKELWEQGRKIIESDNKGTWGKNFLAHGAKIQVLFDEYAKAHTDMQVPRITTAEDMNNIKFRCMLREMKIAKGNMAEYEKDHNKRVRVLAFSHENSFLHFLDKEFNQQGIDKLEAVGYDIVYDNAGQAHYAAAIENRDHQSAVKEIELPKLVSV